VADHEAQPAGIGGQAVGWQDQEHGCGAGFEVGEAEVRAGQHLRHAGAVEKMGMALGGGQHAGGFTIGLTQVTVGGARDEPAYGGVR